MEDLVFIHDFKNEPYTTVDVIVHYTKTSRHAVMQLINVHKSELGQFGVVAFEMRKPVKGSQGGRPYKEWHLNEPQATLLMTMLDNTPVVANFKLNLVKAFYEKREEVAKQQSEIEKLKPVNKDLHQVIKDCLPDVKSYTYSNFDNLACKVAVGLNPKQIKNQYHVTDFKQVLSVEQLERLKQVRLMFSNLIQMGMTYQDILKASELWKPFSLKLA